MSFTEAKNLPDYSIEPQNIFLMRVPVFGYPGIVAPEPVQNIRLDLSNEKEILHFELNDGTPLHIDANRVFTLLVGNPEDNLILTYHTSPPEQETDIVKFHILKNEDLLAAFQAAKIRIPTQTEYIETQIAHIELRAIEAARRVQEKGNGQGEAPCIPHIH